MRGDLEGGEWGDARTFPEPRAPRIDFFRMSDGEVARAPESVCGPAWAAGAAHWLARPARASPRAPAPSPTVNYQPPRCGRQGAGWRPRGSGSPDRFCMTIDVREGSRQGGRTAPGSASHHGDEAFPP